MVEGKELLHPCRGVEAQAVAFDSHSVMKNRAGNAPSTPVLQRSPLPLSSCPSLHANWKNSSGLMTGVLRHSG